MHSGKPVARQWLLVLTDGSFVIDWGDGRYQDLETGQFVGVIETQISHTARDLDLDVLKHASMISGYDAQNVYLLALPEQQREDID